MTAILEPLADPEPATPRAAPGRLAPWKTGWGRRLPLLPALLYVILLTQVPFLYTIWYSFQHWILTEPGHRHFVGFSNYSEIFHNALFRGALYNSLKLTVLTVVISLVLGLAFAVLLDRKFLGRSVARTLLITPFLVMPSASGQIWKNLMLDPSYGLLNWLLSPFGVHHEAFATVHPLASVVGVQVWEWTPFMTLIIIAGLQSQPGDTLEAAQVDGAGPWATFRELTLPHLRPYIELGVLLGAIYVVNEFDIVDTLTQGGPGTATENIPYYLYQLIVNGGNVGQTSAIGVVTVVLTLIVASFALRLISSVFRLEPGK
jgi:sorbitol/mannitol transport system permease protein